MSDLNHFALSALLHSEIVGVGNFGHGQIASLGDGQRYLDTLATSGQMSERDGSRHADLESVVKAFVSVRDARGDKGSPDLYVADPSRNSQFLAKCRSLGVEDSDYAINKTLLYARKNNHLPGLNSVRTSIDYERQAFACEFAATDLRYRTGASIDDILCDPKLASDYDQIARRITPGLTPFEYRWAILSIRKAGRHQALPDAYEMPKFGGGFRLVDGSITGVPDAGGVYLLYERQKLLYARSTEHLRQGVDVHRNPSVLGAITAKLWRPKPENFLINYAVINYKKTFLQAVEKRVIEELHPVFNVPRSAA